MNRTSEWQPASWPLSRWVLAAVLGLGGAGCFDDVDGDERDTMETGVQDVGPEAGADGGDPDRGDPPDVPIDMAVDAIIDADLRDCMPGDDGGECAEGRGACRVEGRKVCVEGRFECDAVAGEPGVEICNDIDDDCDGTVDEEAPTVPCYTGPEGTEDVGQCKGGQTRCPTGPEGPGECLDQQLPTDETCDGADQDCDGVADNDVPPTPCYTGAPGTEGVGTCAGGAAACIDGMLGPCEGEVVPAAEVCDGRDEDCDGRVDVGADPDAGDALVPVCGALVARHCRLWLGWTSDDRIDPGEDMSRSFVSWGDCPDVEESIEDPETRCTNSAFDESFHTLPFPEGRLVSRDDRLAIRWQCDRAGVEGDEEIALLDAGGFCRVTLGERYVPGDLVLDEWPPCDAEGETLYGVAGQYRCTSTRVEDRWAALWPGRTLGLNTGLSVAFRCDGPRPTLPHIEQQTEIWLGWSARDAEVDGGGAPQWDLCAGPEPVVEGTDRCVSSAGDRRFHVLPITIGDPYDPGRLGIAVRARLPSPEDER